MSHLASIASSAARAAIKVKVSIIICFTSTEKAARLIAKYRHPMPVLSAIVTRSKAAQARQPLAVRALFPLLAEPRNPDEGVYEADESVLKVATDYGMASEVLKSRDRVVVCQKIGDVHLAQIRFQTEAGFNFLH